jgi:hypothetical protein
MAWMRFRQDLSSSQASASAIAEWSFASGWEKYVPFVRSPLMKAFIDLPPKSVHAADLGGRSPVNPVPVNPPGE